MKSRWRRIALRYVVAVVLSVAAFAVALTLQRPWVTLSPFFLFYAAVAASSWFGGTGPGVLATIFGALAADYYLLAPTRSLRIDQPQDVARFVLFVSVGVLIASLNGALRRAQHRCEVEADAARRSEARAKRLAEADLIGVFFSNLQGTIRWANREFLRLVGKTPDELASGTVNWRDVTAPEHRGRDERAIRELRECRVCAPFEKDHLLRDGQRIPVLVGCAALSDLDDVVGFVLDLTERKEAEAEAKRNQERLRAMGSELMMAEERERRRIATVLHDSVVQMLALAKLKVDGARRAAGGAAAEHLNAAYKLIDESIGQTRTLTAELSPPVLYELGLAAAIQWLGDRFQAEHGISFQLDGERAKKPLSDEVRTVLFQAVRELMVNIVKHARASKCRVVINRPPDNATIQIVVEDNGVGFADSRSSDYAKGGYGLFNIRQRVAHLGGKVDVDSRPGGGSRITITAPTGMPAAAQEVTP